MASAVEGTSKLAAVLLVGTLSAIAPAQESQDVERALARGARWLADKQQPNGAIPPLERPSIGPLLTTATVLWAVARIDRPEFSEQARLRAVGYLAEYRRKDGSFQDGSGLAAYTTGVACRALREVNRRTASRQLEQFASEGERYVEEVYYERAMEVGIEGLEAREGELPPPLSRAARFLASVEDDQNRRGSGTAVPLFTFTRLPGDDPRIVRALASARTHYPSGDLLATVPEITEHYAESRLLPAAKGVLFGALVLAQTLAQGADAVVVGPDGASYDWSRELSSRLVETQRPDGSWVEPKVGEPVLSTAYALLALTHCREFAARSQTDR